jgi:hypothetical protein
MMMILFIFVIIAIVIFMALRDVFDGGGAGRG